MTQGTVGQGTSRAGTGQAGASQADISKVHHVDVGSYGSIDDRH